MARTTRIVVTGLAELRQKLGPELIAGPLRDCFRRSSDVLLRRARGNAPVYSGKLRASLGQEIHSGKPPKWARVGTDLYYAPFMEHGTGAFGKSTDHWPPGEPLDAWAKGHGFESGWHAARAIGRRGGVRARPFLRPALKHSVADIRRFVERMGAEIRRKFGR